MELLISGARNKRVLRQPYSIYVKLVPEILVVEDTQQMNLELVDNVVQEKNYLELFCNPQLGKIVWAWAIQISSASIFFQEINTEDVHYFQQVLRWLCAIKKHLNFMLRRSHLC